MSTPSPDPQICSSGFPEVVKRYIDPKTLRWVFSRPDLDYRTEHFIVGTNLILCAVYDFSKGMLVMFPERHINWKGTGYMGWYVTVALGNLPCSSKIWKRHALRVATALRTELQKKGVVGPKDHYTSGVQGELGFPDGFPDEKIPSHAFIRGPVSVPVRTPPRPRKKPLKTVVADDDNP